MSKVKQNRNRANFVVAGASAYWKNDAPGGLGVGFDFSDDAQFGRKFVDGLERALGTWDENATVEDMLEQLAELSGKGAANLSSEEHWIAFVNILWLETRGHLKSDEFNGCIFLEGLPPKLASKGKVSP